MKFISRLSSSVISSFDWVVSQIENHEALVVSAIREMQDKLCKARVQLRRVKEDGKKLNARLETAKTNSTLWHERAVQIKDKDRAKALECLKRKALAQREVESLQIQIEEHNMFETGLEADLAKIESQIEVLHRKKNEFVARQLRSEATRISCPEEVGLVAEIEDIFSRWETRLCEEAISERTIDSFALEFESAEETARLEAELDELRE